jgi:hypothetical protein
VHIPLSTAVAQAHRRLFPDEPYRHPKTLEAIALALSALMPIYRANSERELTEPELLAERFTESAMARLAVSTVRLEAALVTMQVASLEMARVTLTMRQSPRPSGRR